MRKQEPSSKQKRSSSYLSDTLLLIQTHTLSCSSSSAHSTLHLTLPFLKVCHPFPGIPLHYFLGLSHHLPLIPLLSCMVLPLAVISVYLSYSFPNHPLTQADTHASFSPDIFCFLLSRMFGTPVGKQWGLEASNNIRGYMPYGHLQGDVFSFLSSSSFPRLLPK